MNPARRPMPARAWMCVIGALVLLIGFFDYLSGFEWSLLLFYMVPVCLAVTQLGVAAGATTAFVSVAVWLVSDKWAGAHYESLASWWNALIALITFLIVVWLLAGLLARQRVLLAIRRELEDRVRERTAALTEEIAERNRLEKIVLEISERERRGIGRELHDGLGQHLTGVALAAKVLAETLAARDAAETAAAQKLVVHIEEGIGQTRMLAKGLLLAEVTPDGLATALAELAADTGRGAGVKCALKLEGEPVLSESGAATHLFRIAQEAVRNAVRHGRARNVEIVLESDGTGWSLSVDDDGLGLPPAAQRGQGLGLRIMAHRAGIIGARFSIENLPGKGVRVFCRSATPAPPL